ncbi:N-glycosylase/DNA lyase [Candidatus Woesearchaeota archaeon]|nr:N-glycosylase/DNA lyase [Candidatus Woesearchaeota archaeon]
MHALTKEYSLTRKAIFQRLEAFSRVSEDDIFYELCFCLLTPQSKGKMAWGRIEKLKKAGFKDRHINPHRFINDMRFHNHKNNYLLAAKQQFPLILQKLQEEKNAFQLREWLVEHIKGYGYKEASHFLRNIGYRNLAILDRHILKNLVRHNVIQELPKTLTRKRYLAIEQQFLAFAKQVNIPMDALDILFWSNETGEIFK